ncbi:uncharacterized protein LOC107463917 [Arachis duranensis]|uniref:Uncharacterized protein LOC107463917 n=1 Tax=Arachis duranensis TaxID=130453 RepID=A0A6P4BZI4_ARADU|nr:uncharacterized protein LOC107463917 [Arachis duranensis]
MASEESFVVLVHHRGSIKRKTRSSVKFTDKYPLCIIVRPTTRYEDLVSSVLLKLGLEGVKQETIKYDCFTIGSDEDLQVMFHCRRQFPELGGSNRNTTTSATIAGSSSRPAIASSSVPAYEPPVQPVASPSFAVDLNGSVGKEVGEGEYLRTSLQCVAPDGVGDGFLDDPEDDDVEPDMIAYDSGDDVGASEHAGVGGGSSSGMQQYPSHFSSLDLDAMRQEGVPGQPAGFGARDAEGSAGLTEFQVGQQFPDKEEAMLSVKTYSIRQGVQYKVVESDYRRYVGKCSEFGNGCTWLIRLSLRQRKGLWEVKHYNGPHTCLATSISSDHRSLDYHVISAFIMPMARADASVNIKVLLNATVAHFGFRPTYRRVWLAKQKAVVLIYSDWDESYNELPRWVLGVQLTMSGTVAVLRMSPVRVSGQLDDSRVEGENVESWSFFLSHLREHVTPQPGLLVISNRHNDIKVVLEAPDGGWLPPSAYRAFCIRHVAVNFALTFKGKDTSRLLVNAAYAKTEVEFHY